MADVKGRQSARRMAKCVSVMITRDVKMSALHMTLIETMALFDSANCIEAVLGKEERRVSAA